MYKLAVIIDDDPISILVCETMLRKADFVVSIHSFNQAEEGLAFLKTRFNTGEGLPDFIFLDVQMPGMDGWDFLKKYSTLPNLPAKAPHVVMLSALSDPEDKQKASEDELVIDFIEKPITLEALENFGRLK